MCSTHICTKPLTSPRNRFPIKRNNGRILHFISSFVTRISSSANVSSNAASTSPTTWANSLYSGSRINSTKLRWAELCGGFFVNLRLIEICNLISFEIESNNAWKLTFLVESKHHPISVWQNHCNSPMDKYLSRVLQMISMWSKCHTMNLQSKHFPIQVTSPMVFLLLNRYCREKSI